MAIATLGAMQRLGITLSLALISIYANAQVIQITDIKVRLFLQFSGEFSTPLTENEQLWNIAAGGGGLPEPASSAFVDVTVSGPPRAYVARQSVGLVVTNERTGKVIARLRGHVGIFGPSGQTHVGFWLSSVGCDPLALVASTGSSSRSQSLPFRCGE